MISEVEYYNMLEQISDGLCADHRAKFNLPPDPYEEVDCDSAICCNGCPFRNPTQKKGD